MYSCLLAANRSRARCPARHFKLRARRAESTSRCRSQHEMPYFDEDVIGTCDADIVVRPQAPCFRLVGWSREQHREICQFCMLCVGNAKETDVTQFGIRDCADCASGMHIRPLNLSQAYDRDHVRLLVRQTAGGKHSVLVLMPSEMAYVLNPQGSPQVGLSVDDPSRAWHATRQNC